VDKRDQNDRDREILAALDGVPWAWVMDCMAHGRTIEPPATPVPVNDRLLRATLRLSPTERIETLTALNRLIVAYQEAVEP
jgi:hypothetical protein